MKFKIVTGYTTDSGIVKCNLLAMERDEGILNNRCHNWVVTGYLTTRGRFIPNKLGNWMVNSPDFSLIEKYKKVLLYGERGAYGDYGILHGLYNRHGDLLFTLDGEKVICGDHLPEDHRLFDDIRHPAKVVGYIH